MTEITTYYKWKQFKSHFKQIPLFSPLVRYVKWRFIWPLYAWFCGEKAKITYWFKKKGILSFSENDRKLQQLKNSHKGETAFIIGNGPSLRAEDLDILSQKGIFCFAANRINVIFSQTNWRPNCYTAIDPDIYRNGDTTIENTLRENLDLYVVTKQIFSGFDDEYKNKSNSMFFDMKPISYYSQIKEFSDNPLVYLMNGFSVTYLSMQLAYYMGFKNVYLLGVDCDYGRVLDKNGKVTQDESKQSYFSKNYDTTNTNSAFTEGMIQAYEYARQFAEQTHGTFNIFNASRGGKLKVFTCVEFKDVCEQMI